MRIGINTGLVVVGKIGDDLRMGYTAVGDAINLAACPAPQAVLRPSRPYEGHHFLQARLR
jgi:class 3 adenylate cyclase